MNELSRADTQTQRSKTHECSPVPLAPVRSFLLPDWRRTGAELARQIPVRCQCASRGVKTPLRGFLPPLELAQGLARRALAHNWRSLAVARKKKLPATVSRETLELRR